MVQFVSQASATTHLSLRLEGLMFEGLWAQKSYDTERLGHFEIQAMAVGPNSTTVLYWDPLGTEHRRQEAGEKHQSVAVRCGCAHVKFKM